MNLAKLLQDDKFNIFFSFLLGIGIICMIRPMCNGEECNVKKAPSEKDFDQFVYRLSDKCYSYKTETVECPTTGAIESFRTCPSYAKPARRPTSFAMRSTPILTCE